jgi:hypothetical protein
MMIYMMKKVEEHECTIYSVFPLRSAIIPKHFRLDTTSLTYLLFTNENGKRSFYTTKGVLKEKQSEIWSFFFNTDKKCFHMPQDGHSHTFHHQIETDGLSCSIILIRKDKVGQRFKAPKAEKERKEDSDELENEERLKLVDKNVVGIDPNMSDLIFGVNSD